MDSMEAGEGEERRQQPSKTPRVVRLAAAPTDIRSVCVIGGGPAGLSCCRALCDGGLDVTLVQESRGLGGKLCTKFINGKDDPSLHFDMGVQLLRPQGSFKHALEAGVPVAPWPAPGRYKELRCEGVWGNWRLAGARDLSTEGLLVGVPSMSAIGRHLAEQCKGLTVHIDRTATVSDRNHVTGRWNIEWQRASPTGRQLQYRPELKGEEAPEIGHGCFDAVVLAFESNKILRGCKSGYKMTSSSATPHIRQRLTGKGGPKTGQMWNLMVAFDTELKMPWDAAMVEGHPAISWVAVDSSKPSRASLPQCFMCFSTRDWADYQQWGKAEVERELTRELQDLLERILGKRPPRPCFVLAGRWGNSTEAVMAGSPPEGEFPARNLGFHAGPAEVVWDEARRMGATGDWTRGFSVSDAYEAGQELAASILSGADRVQGA
jgi:predicted NAD/FAD-dependent oxidoreductase